MRSVCRLYVWEIGMLLILCVCGCASKELSQADPMETTQTEKSEKSAEFGIYQNGFAVLGNYEMHTIYLDEEHAYIPLCMKPDCSHNLNDTSCRAVLLAKESGGWIRYYQGYLWFIPWGLEEDCYLYRADLWGDNLKIISQVMPGLTYNSPVLFRDGKMIRAVCNFTHDEDFQSTGMDSCITEIALDTGEETILEGVIHWRNACLDLIGAYGNSIYYKITAGASDEYPDGAVLARNMDTGEHTVICDSAGVQRQAIGICGQWLFVKENTERKDKIWQYDLEVGTKTLLALPEEAEGCDTLSVFVMEDHLLIFTEKMEWWKYEPKNGDMNLIRTGSTLNQFSPIYQTETGYLGLIIRPATEAESRSEAYAFLSFEGFERSEDPIVLSQDNRRPFGVQ